MQKLYLCCLGFDEGVEGLEGLFLSEVGRDVGDFVAVHRAVFCVILWHQGSSRFDAKVHMGRFENNATSRAEKLLLARVLILTVIFTFVCFWNAKGNDV